MQEKEPILKVEDLHYAYNGEKAALNGIDLNIYEGEKIAVLGSNGAGKSTFFLNINGVLKSHHGEIYYRGEKITKKNLNNLRKNVGIVFQDYCIYSNGRSFFWTDEFKIAKRRSDFQSG